MGNQKGRRMALVVFDFWVVILTISGDTDVVVYLLVNL